MGGNSDKTIVGKQCPINRAPNRACPIPCPIQGPFWSQLTVSQFRSPIGCLIGHALLCALLRYHIDKLTFIIIGDLNCETDQ